MRSLELHVFETERDVDLAIHSGTVLPEQLAAVRCFDCDGRLGYDGETFEPFVFVIDENDQDWVLCTSCAGGILSYVDTFFPPVTHSHFQVVDPDEYEIF